MIIGIDIDDTISDTYAYLFPYAQKYTAEDLGRKIEISDKNRYIENMHKWTEEEEKQFFDKYYEETLQNVKPKLFAAETMKQLKKEGHKIVLITARFPFDKFDVKETTQKWLKENNIQYDELIINAQNKAEIAKRKKVDIFIDDNIHNCEKVEEVQIKTFMMDAIDNLNYRNDKIEKVYSWPHFYQQIHNIEEENR